MIKYLLKCNDCDQEFEAGLDLEEYDKLRKLKLLLSILRFFRCKKVLDVPNLLTQEKRKFKKLKN